MAQYISIVACQNGSVSILVYSSVPEWLNILLYSSVPEWLSIILQYYAAHIQCGLYIHVFQLLDSGAVLDFSNVCK